MECLAWYFLEQAIVEINKLFGFPNRCGQKAGCLSMQMTEFCQHAVPVNKNNIHRFGGANKII